MCYTDMAETVIMVNEKLKCDGGNEIKNDVMERKREEEN